MMIRCFGYGNDDENDGGKVFGNSGDEQNEKANRSDDNKITTKNNDNENELNEAINEDRKNMMQKSVSYLQVLEDDFKMYNLLNLLHRKNSRSSSYKH